MTGRISVHLAAHALGVQPRTIYRWAREGRCTRYPDGFDPAELLAAEASRDTAALLSRAGVPRAAHPKLSDTPGTVLAPPVFPV